ncbi:MAG: HupE/UreJ family protein [Capnocytophaga sp.]|nr:HupE/UreJ family protein [Capnocytophaga sp.]
MNQFIHFFQTGFFHIVSLQSVYPILFVLLFTITLAFSDWKRVLVLVSAVAVSHALALLLAHYGIIRLSGNLGLAVPLIIFFTALFHIFTAGKPAQKDGVGLILILTIVFGFIRGLTYSGFSNATKGTSELLSLLAISVGIWCGLFVLSFLLMLIGYAIQFLFRFSNKEWVLCGASIVIGYISSVLLKFLSF